VRALREHALKLTLRLWNMREGDLASLRRLRMTDRGIVDANQVATRHLNRVADGLGGLESYWRKDVRRKQTFGVGLRLE
jgi:hypothetical protein